MHWISFNGRKSTDYGLFVTKKTDVFTAAQRDSSLQSVPGRDGDVVIDNGRYKNIPLTYEMQLVTTASDFASRAKAIREWLGTTTGYVTLFDSYDENYFRLAVAQSVSVSQDKDFEGKINFAVNCKPFRYSFAGQNRIELTSSGTVTNPESSYALPHIKITGSGNVTLHINNNSYQLSTISPNIEIDSEMMSVYRGTTLLNSKAGFDEFPVLDPGDNSISWTGAVTKVEIVPRWRCL